MRVWPRGHRPGGTCRRALGSLAVGRQVESQAAPSSLKALIINGCLPNALLASTALVGHTAFLLYSVNMLDDSEHFLNVDPALCPGMSLKASWCVALSCLRDPVRSLVLWSVLIRVMSWEVCPL